MTRSDPRNCLRAALLGLLVFLLPASSPGQGCTILELPGGNPAGASWTGGRVPYVFASNVSSTQQSAMQAAMGEWQAAASVSFVPRTTESDYLLIQNSTGNSSYVGRVGGAQPVNIYNWNYRFIMCHELGHALGLHHEHQRPDRDSYVTIQAANITPGQEHNFAMRGAAYGPYDFDSVMHYEQDAFSRNGSPTIIVRSPWQCWQSGIGQLTHLSQWDRLTMQYRYGPTPPQGSGPLSLLPQAHDPQWGWHPDFRWFAGDANGDGKSDVMLVASTLQGGGNTTLHLALSQGTAGYRYTGQQTAWSFSPGFYWFPGDVNGDRKTDFMMVANTGPNGSSRLHAALSDGTGNFQLTGFDTGWGFSSVYRWFPADVNGDGRSDFVLVANTGSGGTTILHVAFSNGDGTFRTTGRATSWGFDPMYHWFPGDVNGDGRADVMLVAPSASGTNLHAALSDGTGGFQLTGVATGWAFEPYYRWFAGDVNGDGKSDFVFIANTAPSGTSRIHVAFSDGTGSYRRTQFDTGWGWDERYRWFAGDANGDGATDVMLVARHDTDLNACGPHTALHVALSDGTGGFVTTGADTGWGFDDGYRWFPGDLDGDRRTDFHFIANTAPGGNSRLHAALIRGVPAMASLLGTGCGPRPITATLASTRPIVGMPMNLSITGGPAAYSGMLLISTQPGARLPLATGCTLLLNPFTLTEWFRVATNSAGEWRQTLVVPGNPALVGASVLSQGVLLASLTQFELTNGLALTFGSP